MSKKKILKVFLSFSIMLVLIINTVGIRVNAESTPKELNQMGFVDQITMTPNELTYGEHTKISVTFSEKNFTINPGDTLTLMHPENIGLFDFDKPTIDLSDSASGKVYATAEVSPDKNSVIITFNENVKMFSEFQGEFYFSGRAGFVGPDDQEEWSNYRVDYKTDLGTDAPKVDYSITTSMVIGTNPFVYKTNGSIWPTNRGYVAWNISINRDQNLFLSDLYVVDEFSEGQEFALENENLPLSINNLDSLRTYIQMIDEKDGDARRLTISEFVEKGYGKFTIDPNNSRKFEFIVYKDKISPTQKVGLNYQTKITSAGKFMPKFYNSAISKWTLADGTPQVREDLDREADNIFEGGIVAPKKGTLRIVKTINDNGKSEQLGEVTFKMFHEDGTPVAKLENIVLKTNSSGVFDTPVLDQGKYYITEISAPDYATFDPNEKFPFEIKDADLIGISLVVPNGLTKQSINVEKQWFDKETTHNSITVDLLANSVKIDTVELKEGKWSHEFINLPTHTLKGEKINYTVEESPVNGYKSVVVGNETDGFIIENRLNGQIGAEKKASKGTVNVGDKFNYTIVAKNIVEDSSPLNNVSIKDILPEGIEFTDSIVYVDGVAQDSVVSGRGFEVIIPSLAFGKDVEVTFEVIATGSKLETVVNKATVTNPEDPTNPIEPEVPVVVTPDKAVVTAEKLVSKDTVSVNEKFNYTIKVSNTTATSLPVENVSVKDTLPEGIEFTDSIVYVDGVAQEGVVNGRGFEVNIPSLAYGKNVEITFEVNVTGSKLETVVNKATVTNPEDPTNPIEPEVPVVVTPDKAVITAKKLVSKDTVNVNEKFNYTIKVSNTTATSLPVENVSIKDTLPEGIEFTDSIIYVDGVAQDGVVNGRSFEVIIPSLAYSKDVEITFEVIATGSKLETVVNKATVTNPEDPTNPIEPEVPVVVTPDKANIYAEKLVDKAVVNVNEKFNYSIKVSNTIATSLPVENVSIKDILPEGIEFTDTIVYVDGVAQEGVINGRSFEVIIPSLSYGKDVEVTFEVIATGSKLGGIVNKATVTNPEDPTNPIEPEVPVVVTPDKAVITAEKLVSKDTVNVNEKFNYTIKVSNTTATSLPVENVSIKDTLPEGIEFTDSIIYVDGVAYEGS
ncbi:DUF11 domain-containing protein [Erysipelothrix inopinata]|uniref:DUF11 domain-containing protein n=1 Tax=Erysipelothrix inopinata TaxID=225084 RepID=A0A7G9RWS0_9FIRM|nr:Cna B-type domain-containing protein [Erysipelothrix inopinata]QNN60045.1 DUF11 domain-containing protein [Erysipelothrix inopinata]